MTDIVTATTGALAALAVARDYAARAMSPNTLRAYGIGWRHFEAFAAGLGWQALPADPAHVGAYIASLATTHSAATIDQRLAAIAQAHRLAGHEWNGKHSAITQTLRAVLRDHGRAPRQAEAIGTDLVTELVGTCDDSPHGVRDRALLLIGFSGALRRSEIVALQVPDVRLTNRGIRLTIRRSKTDQSARGATLGIPAGANPDTCPLIAVTRWLTMLGLEAGPLFRRLSKAGNLVGDQAMLPAAVEYVLAKRVALAGIEAELTPHGLRAGFITVAYGAGVRDDDIMRHTRHRDVGTMRKYIRRAGLLDESPAGRLGL